MGMQELLITTQTGRESFHIR